MPNVATCTQIHAPAKRVFVVFCWEAAAWYFFLQGMLWRIATSSSKRKRAVRLLQMYTQLLVLQVHPDRLLARVPAHLSFSLLVVAYYNSKHSFEEYSRPLLRERPLAPGCPTRRSSRLNDEQLQRTSSELCAYSPGDTCHHTATNIHLTRPYIIGNHVGCMLP